MCYLSVSVSVSINFEFCKATACNEREQMIKICKTIIYKMLRDKSYTEILTGNLARLLRRRHGDLFVSSVTLENTTKLS